MVSTDKIRWVRDIQPFFQPTYLMIFFHLINYSRVNLALPIFLVQLLVIYKHTTGLDYWADIQNISRKSERAFFNDQRFLIPVYSTVIFGAITWIWALCVYSDDVQFETYYLSSVVRPQSWTQTILLLIYLGFFSSLSTTACHELLHRREY